MLMLEKNKGLKLVSAAFIYFFKYERANKTQNMQKENNKEQKSE